MIFNTTIHGIPAQCRVIEYSPARPMRIYGPGLDADPPEPAVFEVEILDRTGHRAHWLDKYIDREVKAQLLEEARVMYLADQYAYNHDYEDAAYPA